MENLPSMTSLASTNYARTETSDDDEKHNPWTNLIKPTYITMAQSKSKPIHKNRNNDNKVTEL
jgi:hypothetical protein